MKNEEEDFDIEECSYSIGPDGSEFYHCTPEILGPSSSSILALDYNRMTLEKIEVFYYWDSVEGQNIPNLELSFINWYPSRWPRKAYRLKIRCYFYWIPADLSGQTRIMPLPDLNQFTPFTENRSSLVIKFYWNHVVGDAAYYSVYDSSLTLKYKSGSYPEDEYASLTVSFYEMRFEIEKIENENG